jgi:hypothetical protein
MTTADQSQLYPVVCRLEGMHPSDIKRYEFHRQRLGGDIGHVQTRQSRPNKLLIGKEDWADRALDLLDARKAENFADELESLKRRKRKKDMMRRIVEGPHDPWRPTRHGPLREVILTANKDWFDSLEDVGGATDWDARERAFERRAVSWLKQHFGDAVIHARADRDEETYHIHAVIACWKRVKIKSSKHSGAERWMLQPSANPLIEDYEKAQDSVGKAFASIGLTRGERRKQAFRDAIAKGEMPPPRRDHVRPVEYRRKEDIRQAAEKKRFEAEAARVAERETAAEAKEAEAEAIIAGAEGIGDGSLELVEHEAASELRPAKASNGTNAEDPVTLSLLARLAGSARGQSRIAGAMSAALGRLRARAEAAAEAKARTALAREHADMEAARDAFVEFVALIPEHIREQVAKANSALEAKLMRLRKSLGAAGVETGANQAADPSKGGQGEEK